MSTSTSVSESSVHNSIADRIVTWDESHDDACRIIFSLFDNKGSNVVEDFTIGQLMSCEPHYGFYYLFEMAGLNKVALGKALIDACFAYCSNTAWLKDVIIDDCPLQRTPLPRIYKLWQEGEEWNAVLAASALDNAWNNIRATCDFFRDDSAPAVQKVLRYLHCVSVFEKLFRLLPGKHYANRRLDCYNVSTNLLLLLKHLFQANRRQVYRCSEDDNDKQLTNGEYLNELSEFLSCFWQAVDNRQEELLQPHKRHK